MVSLRDPFTITIPLSQADRQQAQAFAQEQPTTAKARRVYQNTLAVLVMHHYFDFLEVPTDLAASHSWNPMGRLCANVADLMLPGLGQLECCAVQTGERSCGVPPESWAARVGYAVVQFDSAYHQGTILGFSAAVSPAFLAIEQLQPLEQLLIHLDALRHAIAPTATIRDSTKVQLRQWFNRLFEPQWQAVEAILGAPQRQLAFRSSSDLPSVRRAKLIDLGIQLAEHAIALVVEIQAGSVDQSRAQPLAQGSAPIHIRLQVHPIYAACLPSALQLMVESATGETVQAQAREADNYLQLQFSGQPGEQFSVTLVLHQVRVTERFEI